MSKDKAALRSWTKAQIKIGRRAAGPVIVLSVLSALSGAGQMWCMARVLAPILLSSVTDAVSDTGGLPGFIAGFGLFSLLRIATSAGADMLAAQAGDRARRRLRTDILRRVSHHGPSLLRRMHSGALTTLIVDRVEAADGFFARFIPASTLWLLIPAILLVPIALLQEHSAFILLCCGLSVPVCQAVFGIGAAVASRNQFLAMTRLQARFLDRIRGIATIVLSGRAEDEAKKLEQAASDLRQRTMKVLRVAFLSSASIDCAMVVALILVAVTDGRLALHMNAELQAHSISSVEFLTFATSALFVLLMVPEFFAPFRSLALVYQERAHAQGLAAAMLELPELPVQEHSGHSMTADNGGVSVAFEHVGFTWDPARGQVLHDVSFSVPAGGSVILSGASGSGKSTIMELLLNFVQPECGRITIAGTDLQEVDPDSWTGMVSWIGQRPTLFAGTLRQNILFAHPTATEKQLMEAVQAASIDKFLSVLPQGLDTLIGEGGFGLSGGQAQRVAIARAWLKNAPLLLLDEPTAHLDPETESEIFESLSRLAEHRTLIMATHSMTTQRIRGQRIELSNGRIQAHRGAA
ncbi:MAG: thiol reductant ABC exporter subunit CydD [Acetobacter sp.]|jgi:ATP-binding cassette subfamily C protein CydD